jgi:hypothetical protein
MGLLLPLWCQLVLQCAVLLSRGIKSAMKRCLIRGRQSPYRCPVSHLGRCVINVSCLCRLSVPVQIRGIWTVWWTVLLLLVYILLTDGVTLCREVLLNLMCVCVCVRSENRIPHSNECLCRKDRRFVWIPVSCLWLASSFHFHCGRSSRITEGEMELQSTTQLRHS